jgi:hypothetical protein
VTTGNNQADPSIPGYPATVGWDPVTGLGTPNAAALVPALAAGQRPRQRCCSGRRAVMGALLPEHAIMRDATSPENQERPGLAVPIRRAGTGQPD